MILKRIIVLVLLIGLVTTACRTNATISRGTSGKNDPQPKENSNGPLGLSFSKSTFTESDTITLTFMNKSDSDISIGLRCGHYPEMVYQKSDKGSWSENKEMAYSMLKCPTRLYTIKPHEKYSINMAASMFNSKGRFRLLVSYTISAENNPTITSEAFEIK